MQWKVTWLIWELIALFNIMYTNVLECVITHTKVWVLLEWCRWADEWDKKNYYKSKDLWSNLKTYTQRKKKTIFSCTWRYSSLFFVHLRVHQVPFIKIVHLKVLSRSIYANPEFQVWGSGVWMRYPMSIGLS